MEHCKRIKGSVVLMKNVLDFYDLNDLLLDRTAHVLENAFFSASQCH